MTNQIKTFTFAPGRTLRAIERDGEPWFVAADICKALGVKDASAAIKAADLDETEFSHFKSGKTGRPALITSESGLYALVMASRKPQARDFRKWVTSVVLPAIRRTGSYILGEEKVQTVEALEALQEAARKRKLDECLAGRVGAAALRDRMSKRFPEHDNIVWVLNGRLATTEFHFTKHLGLDPYGEGKLIRWDAELAETRMLTMNNRAPADDYPDGLLKERKTPGETPFGYLDDLVKAVEVVWPIRGPQVLKARKFLMPT